MDLLRKLESLGVESSMLDDLVHEVYADMASNVNNSGMKDQVDSLLTCGVSEEEIMKGLDLQ